MNFKNGKCTCGKIHTADVDRIITGSGAIKSLPEIIKEYGIKKPFIISDKNTFAAAGKSVCEILDGEKIPYTSFRFAKDNIEPDEYFVGSAVMHFDRSCDAVIGVGSGVINDISKIVSSVAGCRYIIVATAPSMDGYASASSSVSMDGLKVSLPSRCADVIIGDTDILVNAPMNMLKSGIGDMLAKYISICEWRISALVTGEYYCEEIASYIRDALKRCTDNADGFLKRDKAAVEAVFDGLCAGGLAMAYAGLSRPASGVEHYISHIWDMRGLEFGTHCDTHGIQCAVGTLIAARLYEVIESTKPNKEKALEYARSFSLEDWHNRLREFLGSAAETMIELEKKENKYSTEKHEKRLSVIVENWEKITEIINEEIPTADDLVKLMNKLEIPLTAEEIGMDADLIPITFKATKDIRDKYVLSRLAWDLGIIEELKI
ncbi:MAG: sn-glycerol-1-phosphate dehydrogenase [Clostridia bacterium]|nr:sn-glycerol-1-phosphate dehydrogenase [Clostridia bacterium]